MSLLEERFKKYNSRFERACQTEKILQEFTKEFS